MAGSPQARPPLGRFIRRNPVLSFFLWFFTVGQALAFFPILASIPGREVPAQPFVVASTLIRLLLPAVMITYVVDGKAGLRSLWRRVGEEVAWTGLFQARLQAAHGALITAVMAGRLFALKHRSLAVDNSLGGAVMVMVLLTALAIPFRFVTGWLYNRTGSVFLVGLLHGAGNAVAGGSGFQAGYLAAIYPDQPTAYMAHLLALLCSA